MIKKHKMNMKEELDCILGVPVGLVGRCGGGCLRVAARAAEPGNTTRSGGKRYREGGDSIEISFSFLQVRESARERE